MIYVKSALQAFTDERYRPRKMRISDIAADEQAARIRAAIGYSGKKRDELIRELDSSGPSLWRRTSRHAPKGAASLDELYEIADACGVPRWFMEQGFAIPERRSYDDRIGRLEQQMERLADVVEDRLATLADRALEPANGRAASTDRPGEA